MPAYAPTAVIRHHADHEHIGRVLAERHKRSRIVPDCADSVTVKQKDSTQ